MSIVDWGMLFVVLVVVLYAALLDSNLWIKVSMWRHHRQGHEITSTRVSVPLFDPSAKGVLWKCSCGETWSQ